MAQEIKTCKQGLNMTGVTRNEACQTINRSSKQANEHVCAKEDLEMLAVMFARTVPVANKQTFVPTSARKCDAKVLPTNSTIQKSVNPNVSSLIYSHLLRGKIKHAYQTCQANKSGLRQTCQQGLNMTGMTGKQTCQRINGARKQNM